jgi:hypothetical protein
MIDERIERLNRISERRLIDPDDSMPGEVGPGRLVPDELLSVHGLGLDLTAEQKTKLSREEVASMFDAGIRFEAVLESGFALQLVWAEDLTDARAIYLLHEMGEETRHQRLFARVLSQIAPEARNPLADSWILGRLDRLSTAWITRHLAMLYVMVLGGEEIPDLFQKRAAEHPDTDPFLAEVNRYHRQEEARHLSFARSMLPEVWRRAGWIERTVVRRVGPIAIGQMFTLMVHPGVYATVGLDPWKTWKAANQTPERIALKQEATRPVLAALLEAGVLRKGRVPRGWRTLCGVDRHGRPTTSLA